MSTRKLREALELLREDRYPEALAAALREVAAIERAAKIIGAGRVSLHADDPDALSDACDLMERIAGEKT